MCASVYGQDSAKVANGIQLIISTDKSDYLEGENVWLEKKVIIDKKVKLDYRPYDSRDFITNSKNQGIPEQNYTFEDMILDSINEYPDTIYYFYALEFGYCDFVPDNKYFILGPYYFPAEEYKISANVNVMIKGKQYKVEAKPVKFTVHKPEGEDLLARKEYLDIIPLVWATKDYELLDEKVDSFIANHKNSVYLDVVLWLTNMVYHHNVKISDDEAIEFYYNVILLHPEFAGNYFRLMQIMYHYSYKNDRDGYLSMISDLVSRFKDNEIFMKALFHHKRFSIWN